MQTTLKSQLAKAKAEIDKLKTAFIKECNDIEQIAGKALKYPKFCDDQDNFPGSTEQDGVCVGDNVAVSIVAELARKYTEVSLQLDQAKAEIERLKRPEKCPQCGESTVQPRDSKTYCEECGWPDENRNPTIADWQNLIRNRFIKAGVPENRIDGGGCDSGDPLDFSESELSQGINYLTEERDSLRSENQKLKEVLNWYERLMDSPLL